MIPQAKPFLRWAGSKRKQLPILSRFWNSSFDRYVEPFMGSACLLLALNPPKALIGDINYDLVRTFRAVRDHPQAVANRIQNIPLGKRSYYFVRSQNLSTLDALDSAAKFIFLNRFCFNGLYRTNKGGQFNVPYAASGNGADETTIDFVYALGKYDDKDLPMIIEEMVSIPGCEGGALRSSHSLAIFGLGFNGWASLSVLERLEADDVFAFIASPGASHDYPERVRTLNKDFLEEPRVKQNVLELPLRSVETCYRFLSELVAPHRFKDSVTLVPMGPKPHILASILVSMRFPEVSCMRVSATRACPEKVEPSGEIVAVRVVVRKEGAKN